MSQNVMAAVKALQMQITPEVEPDDDYISAEEGKALQAQAKAMLAQAEAQLVTDAVMDHFCEVQFDREQSDEEKMYSEAAKGMLRLYADKCLDVVDVRLTDYMPNSRLDGEELAGHFSGNGGDPRILVSSRNGKAREFNVFAHELGHAIDYFNNGETFASAPKEVWESKADEWEKLLKSTAFNLATRLYYGNKKSLKSIPVEYLLKAMAQVKGV